VEAADVNKDVYLYDDVTYVYDDVTYGVPLAWRPQMSTRTCTCREFMSAATSST